MSDSEKRFPILVSLLVIALDQVTKYLVRSSIGLGDSHVVIPNLFNLVLAYNKGVAFGVFAGIGDNVLRYAVLGVTTLIALGAVYVFARSESCANKPSQIALAMILGGAIGNVIDRVWFGMVTDFLDFYWGTYHWPAFNIADSSICVAVIILLFFAPSKSSQPALQK